MNDETSFWNAPSTWCVILGLLLVAAIVASNFWRQPRYDQSGNTCLANLKQIDGAKEQWALENKKATNDVPTWGDLVGTTLYIRNTPRCPLGGVYKLNRTDTPPVCSQGRTATPPHVLSN